MEIILRSDAVAFRRPFHVELLLGGMNRLLLRSLPTPAIPTRVEVFFQYVQHLNIPMTVDDLVLEDITREPSVADLRLRFPELRIFRLSSGMTGVGELVAGDCVYGEDDAPASAQSMFPGMFRSREPDVS